ncbi:MAG: lactate dehydrogenase [Clostridiales bacterium]|nr:lactate dehydrogenase [Clostridiales bacterium]
MYYYREGGRLYASLAPLSLPLAPAPSSKQKENITILFSREPLSCRTSFKVADAAQLIAEEDISWLDFSRLPPASLPDDPVGEAIRTGMLRAVNAGHPRWREAPSFFFDKKRLNLLALGDVGSTLAIGLRLLGGDVLSSIGLCDLRSDVMRRWEFELGQIALPFAYDDLPPVSQVEPQDLFDCDVFVFCASRYVPPVGSQVEDVRMAQYAKNSPLAAAYARQARKAKFRGLFCIVSDPVDPLCRTVLMESNRDESGVIDYGGLFPEQVLGFGLGVMNARAAYFAKQDLRFASFLQEGRSFGPHGEDLVIANSLKHYDDALSRELTQKVVTANLLMRGWGFKPYAAPALSSGALSLLLMLRGEWHYSSTYLGGIFMGAKNRLTPGGPEIESLSLPDKLFERIQYAAEKLAALQ